MNKNIITDYDEVMEDIEDMMDIDLDINKNDNDEIMYDSDNNSYDMTDLLREINKIIN